MIKPVNGHLLIEPLAHDTFIASEKETYQEIGMVIELPAEFNHQVYVDKQGRALTMPVVNIGDKVYFDSWLAAKYPKNDTEFYWLVKWDDVRAIEKNNEPAKA